MSQIEDACECGGLRAELEVTDKLLEERNRLLAAVPACEIHGACAPHAIEWVEATGRYIEDLEQDIPAQAFRDMKAQLAEVEHERDRALATIDEFDATIDELDRLREAAVDLLSQVEWSDQAERNVAKLAYDEKAGIVRQLIDAETRKELNDVQ